MGIEARRALLAGRLRLYAVTDFARHQAAPERLVAAAVRGGAGAVQLREKHLSRTALLARARALCAVCHRLGALFFVDDDVEVARASGADGVHLGQEDLPAGAARKILGPDAILGVSAHNVREARAAEAAGADYLGSGAVFSTKTKKDASHLGLAGLAEICAAVSLPVVAIGGITAARAGEVMRTGAAGVAVCSGIFGADGEAGIEAAARAFCALVGRTGDFDGEGRRV